MRALLGGGLALHLYSRDEGCAAEVGLRALVSRHLVAEADGLFRANPNERRLLDYYTHSGGYLLGRESDSRN